MRLAEEYDAAQERGEVAAKGWKSGVDKSNTTTAADLGLRRDEIHEARMMRVADQFAGKYASLAYLTKEAIYALSAPSTPSTALHANGRDLL